MSQFESSDILLCTLNARYSHASLGLRYLYANLGVLKSRAKIQEFVIGDSSKKMLETIVDQQPKIVGFGVYIWNVVETTALVAQLKTLAPDICIVVGGPEISYEWQQQTISQYVDYIITGWGEVSFRAVCVRVLNIVDSNPHQLMPPTANNKVITIANENNPAPAQEIPLYLETDQRPVVVEGIQAPLESIVMPYQEYTDQDLKTRNIYVEASRGCPFKCEFCLSSLDKTAWPFPLDTFLDEMAQLYERGARVFKFVDRTFNLNIKTSNRILEFFLSRNLANPNDPVFAHFELVPDHLPDALKDMISGFPAGTLQFEIGIQTFNPTVQAHISRKQNNEKALDNLRWLRNHCAAHLHVDLIAGLPGEDLNSFARGFDILFAANPHEIQVGVLKRLRGTPIIRHTLDFDMRYSPLPPYEILQNDAMRFHDLMRVSRFARYWDLIANSGKMPQLRVLIFQDCSLDSSEQHRPEYSAFWRFMQLSDDLYAQLKLTHTINQDRLFAFVYEWLQRRDVNQETLDAALCADYQHAGNKHLPHFILDKQVDALAVNDAARSRKNALGRQKMASVEIR